MAWSRPSINQWQVLVELTYFLLSSKWSAGIDVQLDVILMSRYLRIMNANAPECTQAVPPGYQDSSASILHYHVEVPLSDGRLWWFPQYFLTVQLIITIMLQYLNPNYVFAVSASFYLSDNTTWGMIEVSFFLYQGKPWFNHQSD